MDNRLQSSLDGKKLRINWVSPKKMVEVEELKVELLSIVNSERKEGESVKDKLDRDKQEITNIYKKMGDIMFEFEGESPDYGHDEFPNGEFMVLQQLFYNPTLKI